MLNLNILILKSLLLNQMMDVLLLMRYEMRQHKGAPLGIGLYLKLRNLKWDIARMIQQGPTMRVRARLPKWFI